VGRNIDNIDNQGADTADGKILKEAKKRLEASWAYDRENREEAIKDLRFLALDQWPQSVRDQRAAEDRPCLTLDHLNQYKNQVVNDIRQPKFHCEPSALMKVATRT